MSSRNTDAVLRSRRVLVSDLVQSVRELTAPRLYRSEVAGLEALVTCCECQWGWTEGQAQRHRAGCLVGRALLTALALDALLLRDEGEAAESLMERDTRGSFGGDKAESAAEEASGYAEPWTVDPVHIGTAVDRFGCMVLDMAGTDLGEHASAATCRRIVESVNFCQGVPTGDLAIANKASLQAAQPAAAAVAL